MKYRIRPGIVLTKVCGTSLLVPDRRASEYCSYVLPMPYLYAAHWKALEKGSSLEQIIQAHGILTKKPDAECRAEIEKLFSGLCDKGFLIMEDEP